MRHGERLVIFGDVLYSLTSQTWRAVVRCLLREVAVMERQLSKQLDVSVAGSQAMQKLVEQLRALSSDFSDLDKRFVELSALRALKAQRDETARLSRQFQLLSKQVSRCDSWLLSALR